MGQAHFPPSEEFPEGFKEVFETDTLDQIGKKLVDALKRGAEKVEAWPAKAEEGPTPPKSSEPTPQVASLLNEILREVKRAVHKFPTWPTDPVHAASILAEEVGELQKGCNELTYEPGKTTRLEVRAEAIESAAMALRFLVSFGIYDFAPSAQHQQDEVFHGPPEHDSEGGEQ